MFKSRHVFWSEVRHRWVEYLLGAVVVGLVSGTLVLQRSVTISAGDRLHDLAHKLGKNMLVVPAAASPGEFYTHRYGDETMPEDYPDRLRGSSLGQHIRVMQAGLNGNVQVGGVSLVLAGERRFRDSGAAAGSPPAAEIGAEAAALLGVGPGDEIEVRGTTLRVRGVRIRPPGGLGTGVFTSLATAQGILERPGRINAMRLGGCWCKLDVPALGGEVENLLPGARAITVAGVLKAQKGSVAVMSRYANVLYLVGVLLVGATVAALVSSQVRRSLREMGLLIAVGASRGTLLGSLLARAALVGLAGGLFGYGLGAGLTGAVGNRLLHLPLQAPAGLWAVALGLCALVSIVAGAWPARRILRLDPAQVLRED